MEQHTALSPDQTPIAYQLAGGGPGLLLLAGQGNSHRWWDTVRDDFTGWTTITLDWRGTGDTPLGEHPLSTRLLAEDAVAVLDDLGLDRVDIYATSMGGRVAQWVAADHPDRVRRLVLGCTSPGARMGRERSQAVRRRLADPDPDRRTEALIDLMYTPAWRAEHPGPYATLGDPTATPRAFQQHLRASNAHDAYDVLDTITAPTLVLHGTDDELSPVANADILAERIPNGRAVVFAGGRHAYFEECRPEASATVIEFLRGDC